MLDKTIEHINDIDAQIKSLKQKREELLDDVQDQISQQVVDQLKGSDYGCGTATIDSEKYQVKYVVSKSVKWDQELLSQKYKELDASPEDVSQYIDTKYSVAESKHNAWPDRDWETTYLT